jgi:hypothetical protein
LAKEHHIPRPSITVYEIACSVVAAVALVS